MPIQPALWRAAVCYLLVTAAWCARAAEPAARPTIEPKAEKVLDAWGKFVTGLQGFRVTVNVALELEQAGQKQNHEFVQNFSAQRPNKLAYRFDSPQAGAAVVSDGRELTVYLKAMQKYGVEDAPANWDALLLNPLVLGPISFGNAAIVTTALLNDHPVRKLLEKTESDKYGGVVALDDAKCHLIQAEGGEIDWQLWIDSGAKPLIRRFVPDLGKSLERMAKANKGPSPSQNMKISNVVTFKDWDVSPKFAADTFVFNVPDGATKAKSMMDILGGGGGQPESAMHPLVGKPAPPVKLDLLDGGAMDLATYKGKKIVILDFWATWCGPCAQAMPIIEKVAKKYKTKGVLLFAVNLEEPPDDVRKFAEEAKIDVPIALDKDGAAARAYEASAIPQTVLIGKDGSVQVVHVGLSVDLEQQLSQELDALVAGKDLAAETLAAAKKKANDGAATPGDAAADKPDAK